MTKTLAANIRRLILATKSRFFALTAIVTIGVAFFVGVSATSPIMGHSVDVYDDEMEMKDITVYSNYGFDQADIDAIQRLDEVELCEGAWFADCLAASGNTTLITRIHSFDPDSRINRFVLREGRLPQNKNEAVAEAGTTLKSGFQIGSTVSISWPEGSENESLLVDEVKIVGTIDTPLYLNMTKENSTLNNQYIETYLYVPDAAFDQEFYLEANVLLKDAKDLYTFSKEYEDFAGEGREAIEALALSQKDKRITRIREDALKEYNDGLKEYEDGLKEFNEKIADGEQQIADGEKEIADGQSQVADGWAEYNDGLNQLNRETADAVAKLNDAAAQAASGRADLEKGKAEFAAKKKELEDLLKQIDDGLVQIDDGLKQTAEGIDSLQQAQDAIAEMKDKILVHEDDPVSVLLEYAPELKELTDMLEVSDTDTVGQLMERLDQMQALLNAASEILANVPDAIKAMTLAEAEEVLDERIVDTITMIAALLDTADTDTLETLINNMIDLVPEEQQQMTIGELKEQLPEETAAIVSEITELLGGDDSSTFIEMLDKAEAMIPEEIRAMTIAEVKETAGSELAEELNSIAAMLGGDENNTIAELEAMLNEKRELLQTASDAIHTMLNEPMITDDTKLSVLMRNEDMKKLADQLGLNEENTVKELEEAISAKIRELQDLTVQLQKQRQDLVNNRQQILDGIADGEKQLKEAEDKLISGEAEIADGWKQLEAETASARDKLYDARKQLLDAEAELTSALSDLADARKELADAKEEGRQELEDAKKKLDDAKKEIDDLKPGEWTVLDRTKHYATATYQNTVDQMKAIGDIFPLFFILVAALVCLTTMTRLVDEQRGEIGTLRALGYSQLQCAGKYLIYAGSATLLGEVIGVIAGMLIFPPVIYSTWGLMYIMPKIRLQMPWQLIILSSVCFLGGMLLTTWYSCRQDMKEVPAQLMRPKAPKLGRKTMIERIPLIWNRLSFTWKVTMRNLFRYKRRFFMTVAGVAGCGALLVTGFGIRDSINAIVDLQFYDIYRYNGAITLDNSLSEEEKQAFEKRLLAREDVEALTEASVYSAKAAGNTNVDETVNVEIFARGEDIKNVYELRTRIGRKPLELNNDGVIISEKLAENLDLKVGDTIALEGADGSFADVPVSAITEMYVQHYVFFTEDVYRQYFKKDCEDQAILITVNGDEDTQKKVESELAKMKEVASVSFFNILLDNFRKMVKGLNYIVWTIILASMSLAFVVLGNLINVNISERQREIATLKVLGFRRKEVESYIYKENNILTLIGAITALPIGTWLHHYIMRTVEMDYVMFGRQVELLSYFYAVGLTLLFGVIVDHFMAGKLHEIQMVESLKSVE
ncbi:MAG: FtsX-like permease family protein [Solobacterium sp.]|nr:FtsX-like permease family protein [Solobacterium sp.]